MITLFPFVLLGKNLSHVIAVGCRWGEIKSQKTLLLKLIDEEHSDSFRCAGG